MAAVGDTVVLSGFSGSFLRSAFVLGKVVAGGGGGATEVQWETGEVASLSTDAQLSVVADPSSADLTAQFLARYVRQKTPVFGSAQRLEGVVIGVFSIDGDDQLLFETALGLLVPIAVADAEVVPGR